VTCFLMPDRTAIHILIDPGYDRRDKWRANRVKKLRLPTIASACMNPSLPR
jgi:hypothetical protein